MHLDPTDTAELVDILRFLRDWTATGDPTLAASLRTFTTFEGFDANSLARDLDRFAVLLDGTADGDGATLFANPT